MELEGKREQVVIFNRPLQMKATGGSGPIISIWDREEAGARDEMRIV